MWVMELLLCGSVLPASRIPALKVGRGESSESCPNPAKVGADHMTASSIEARAGRAGRLQSLLPPLRTIKCFQTSRSLSRFHYPLHFVQFPVHSSTHPLRKQVLNARRWGSLCEIFTRSLNTTPALGVLKLRDRTNIFGEHNYDGALATPRNGIAVEQATFSFTHSFSSFFLQVFVAFKIIQAL